MVLVLWKSYRSFELSVVVQLSSPEPPRKHDPSTTKGFAMQALMSRALQEKIRVELASPRPASRRPRQLVYFLILRRPPLWLLNTARARHVRRRLTSKMAVVEPKSCSHLSIVTSRFQQDGLDPSTSDPSQVAGFNHPWVEPIGKKTFLSMKCHESVPIICQWNLRRRQHGYNSVSSRSPRCDVSMTGLVFCSRPCGICCTSVSKLSPGLAMEGGRLLAFLFLRCMSASAICWRQVAVSDRTAFASSRFSRTRRSCSFDKGAAPVSLARCSSVIPISSDRNLVVLNFPSRQSAPGNNFLALASSMTAWSAERSSRLSKIATSSSVAAKNSRCLSLGVTVWTSPIAVVADCPVDECVTGSPLPISRSSEWMLHSYCEEKHKNCGHELS